MGREPGLHTDAGFGQQRLHWRDRAPIGAGGHRAWIVTHQTAGAEDPGLPRPDE